MMSAGFFFFLLVLTGGKTSNSDPQVHQDDQQGSSGSSEESLGGNTSDSEPKVFHGYNVEDSSDSEPLWFYYDLQEFSDDFEIAGDEENSDDNCSFQDILDHLNLTKDNPKYAMSRPVKKHKTRTKIFINMMIYAILDVREKDQTFISYVWTFWNWYNEHIKWSPSDFCELKHIIVPTEVLWMPDLTIEEMTEKDKAPMSPYLKISHNGVTEFRNDQVVVSTCQMHVYKFPFDIQKCDISFKSILHSDKEIQLIFGKNSRETIASSRKVMRTQFEWRLIDVKTTNKTEEMFGFNQTSIIYTIIMKRRSTLYIANFLLPVLFFLSLDLASFLISHRGGEKLSFKVTVLLAVTVMQLLLNEILPSSSENIPLIAIYCIGVFGMMLLSVIETIFVMYLTEKDFQDDEIDRDRSLNESCEDKLDKGNFNSCFRGIKEHVHCASANDASVDETSVPKEGSSQLTEVSLALGKVSDELGEIDRKMTLLSSIKEEEKPGYWTRKAKRIDKAFSIIYGISAFVFLVVIFSIWSIPDDDKQSASSAN